MSKRGMFRILAALMLTVVLLATAAPATAQPLTGSRTSSWQSAWDAVWTWARLSLGITAAKQPHNKSARDAGCGIDPNGRICE